VRQQQTRSYFFKPKRRSSNEHSNYQIIPKSFGVFGFGVLTANIYTKNVDRKTVRKAIKNATEKRKALFEATIFGFQPAPPWGRKKTRPE
jgi:hypothetical protein